MGNPISEAPIERVPISKITPAPYNPRRELTPEEEEGLRNSLHRWGLATTLTWNRRTGHLVGGHKRLEAIIKESGIEELSVSVVDVSLEEEMAMNVSLNNRHIAGDYSDDLQPLLAQLRDYDVEMFRETNLDQLFEEETPEETEESEVPALPTDTITKPGDLWILGKHRVICGDSSDPVIVTKLIGEDSAQCMWTDPPYGVNYESNPGTYAKQGRQGAKRHKEAVLDPIKNDGKEEALKLLSHAMAVAVEYAVPPGASVYVCSPAGPLFADFGIVLREAGISLRQSLVWFKSNNFSMSRQDYHYQHELCWYGCIPGVERFGRLGDVGWYGEHNCSTVFSFDKKIAKNEFHPTMKPIPWIAAHLSNSTRVEDFVYDPFAGSGSTLIACEKLDRKCLAVELEPAYVDVIVKRFEEETGQTAVRADR